MENQKPHFEYENFIMPFVYRSEVKKEIFDELVNLWVEKIKVFKSRFFGPPPSIALDPITFTALRSRTTQVLQVPLACVFEGSLLTEEMAFRVAAEELGDYGYSFDQWYLERGTHG